MEKFHTILYLFILSLSFGSIDTKTYDKDGYLRYLSGNLCNLHNNIEFDVRKYLYSIKDQIGDNNIQDYKLTNNNKDINNLQHLVFNQTYDGIPVFGKNIRVHILNDMIISLSSNIKNIHISVIPLITIKGAIDLLKNQVVLNSDYLQFYATQIYIYNTIPHLVYTIDLINFDNSWRYMVDAHTGKTIDKFPLIYDNGQMIGSGINLLNEQIDTLLIYEGNDFIPIGENLITPFLLCEEYCFDYGDCGGDTFSDCIISPQQGSCENGYILDCNGDCFNEWYMQFPGVGNGFCNDPWIDYSEENIETGLFNLVDVSAPDFGNIYTINSYGGFYSNLSFVNSETEEFFSSNTYESHKSGVSAHDYQRKTLDYFANHHGYFGIDGNGKRTISVVNYTNVAGGLDQRNAFYNAALDILTYGLGGNGYRPFCAAQDIVTHEFVHGVTAHTSGLIYRNQPGAMNESISDVFGYLVEAKFQNGGDWTQGEDVHYTGASRSFINPPEYNQPDHIDHPYFIEYNSNPQWSNDFGGVHYNSGIPNKIMYLVINGDTHYGITVFPFDNNLNESRNIASSIWFAWNSYYLDPEDDFEIGREKMLQACNDLYPNQFNYYQTIANAWASTGVGSEIVIYPGDINNDQNINILDIIELVNIILNENSNNIPFIVADLNSDGNLNILDIIELVNIILSS